MNNYSPSKTKQNCKIAIIGIGVNYPGAKNSLQLWENILARRQQFREMPDSRLPIKDYYDPDPSVADKTYQKKAAVLDGYAFDWLDRKIPKSTYESTDIVHWLALDTALQSLSDARIHDFSFARETTGVVVGNTLTGEFTRSNHMLLRWPYVKKALHASLKKKGLLHVKDGLEVALEKYYKSVFAPVTEDTLAGGLANTIAGRICNYLDVHGGGFIVDGACSSSLLAICTAANYLELGQMDMVIAGGVDISLDTFELIGFAKTGALTRDEMSVYDKNGKGFIPGEGCGMVIMKRLEDAERDNNQIYAVLEGWGISSDGKGGITAPSAIGQSRALLRAYEKADFDPEKLNFIEGHGTGTTVGDKTELEGITIALNKKKTIPQRNCGVTSFKSIVGHTKAAAGVGAFIKTVMALNRRVIPPTAGLKELNPIFEDKARTIYPILQGQVLDPGTLMYAGVSAMGFGGINSHVVLRSGEPPIKKLQPVLNEKKLLVTNQICELFLFAAESKEALAGRIRESLEMVKGISYAELQDYAFQNNTNFNLKLPYRAAVVSGEPFDLERKLNELLEGLKILGDNYLAKEGNSIVLGRKKDALRIGALFPGQGSQRINMAAKLAQRFDWVSELLSEADSIFKHYGEENVIGSIYRLQERVLNNAEENLWKDILKQTNIAQPAITLASLAWFKYLEKLGIKINAATGHSLGELMAFHATGLLSQETLLKFAVFRGKIMAGCGSGTMASLVCPKETAQKFIQSAPGYVTIANINSPEQTVISGEQESIDYIIKQAEAEHIGAARLPVSAAFHSKLIGEAANQISNFKPLNHVADIKGEMSLISSVSGESIEKKDIDLNQYFSQQCIQQVNFIDAVNSIANQCDVLIEIGPGKTLAGLSENIQNKIRSFPVEARPNDDISLNILLANVFVLGADLNVSELYKDRLIREFVPAAKKEFIINPCEREFPVIDLQEEPGQAGFDTGMLLPSLDINPEQLSAYMSVRGKFIQEIIQADMRYFPTQKDTIKMVVNGGTKESYTPPPIKQVADQETHSSARSVLHSKIEAITGFPAANFKPEMKLLDDFNLDSIKAGSLLNTFFKAVGIQGKINPSNHLNSSLQTILTEAEKFAESKPATGGSGFTIEEVERTVYGLLAEKTDFPVNGMKPEFRLLNDLNLDSIKAASVLAFLIKKYSLQGKIEAAAHANASISEIISKIVEFMPKNAVQDKQRSSKDDIRKLVFDQVEIKTGFPQNRIKPELRLLDDLNLDSIKANSLVAGLAKHFNLLGKLEPAKFSNASLIQLVDSIHSLVAIENPVAPSQPLQENEPEKVESFSVCLTPENLPVLSEPISEFIKSKAIALVCAASSKDKALQMQKNVSPNTLCEVVEYKELTGSEKKFNAILTVLPEQDSTSDLNDAVELLSVVSNYQDAALEFMGFIQVGDGSFNRGGNSNKHPYPCFSAVAFAASLHLERPHIKCRALEFDATTNARFIVDAVLSEFHTSSLFVAAGYDKKQQRRIMQYEPTSGTKVTDRTLKLSENDVVVVTGGAKGITSECAFELAKKYKCKMALVGSSKYNGEAGEISDKLLAYEKEKLVARYYACNISDEAATKAMMDEVVRDMGKVSCIVHGAGKNVPRRAEMVSFDQAMDEISPKLKGAYNLYSAADKKHLKGFVGFTSIIGVTGMAGNSWYAFSNEAVDNFLRNINKQHSIETVSLAYSIWSEVGMGERMGSTDALARMGIGAIHPKLGVAEFMKWFGNKATDQQVVIAATMGNLDTWFRKPYPKPEANRYLENVLSFEKGKTLKARTTLSRQTDIYIEDHDYKGSLLFPTVFGLEAMAQAVAMVMGLEKFNSLKLENISLLKPIVVPENGDTLIEINATVNADGKVKVGISTEHTDFDEEHFSAFFVIGDKVQTVIHNTGFDLSKHLPLDPESDLYSWLLFQGPRFRQIGKVYEVGIKKAAFETRNVGNDTSDLCFSKDKQQPLLLGSPLLRDTLLQSIQLMLTKNIVLPIGIDSWEINQPAIQPHGGTVECHISSWDENTGKCDVIYFNKNKEVIEHIHGYKVKSMEPKANYPASTELNDINTYIHKKVKDEFAAFESKFSENLHLIAYKHDDSFDKISKKDRRVIEQQLLDRHNNAKQALNGFGSKLNIIWNGEGKPHLDPNTGKISISHSKSLLLMTIGNSEQGCDLEFIKNRTREEWTGMLGQNSGKLVDRLMETDKDYDLSATRMWCLQEACIKAFGELPADVSVISTEQRAVFVEVKYQENTNHLITLPIQLFPNVTYMVAVVVKLKGEKPVVENKKPYNIDNIFDTDLRKFVTHFYTAFKDCRGFHGKTHFADIPLWMGNLREYILTPVKKKLLKDLGSGEYGMVTNDSTVRIYEEAGTLDKITGRLWITDKSDLKNSLIDLGYEWLKHTDDGKLIRIADCELSTTWVKIEDRGIVKLSPIPEYFYTYLESHLKNGNSEENLGSVNYPGLSDLGVLIYESPAIPRPSILLNSKSYQTGIYNANTVGNLYYSNYYDWQAKNIESHFFKIIPELYLKNGKAGEYICLEANVNHLQEAMPFEEIEVNMYLEQLYEKGIKLYFEYYSGGSEGKKKLAYGYNILLWAQRKDEESVPAAIEVPATVVKSLGIPVEVKKGVPN